jgi:DNA-binding transcriptional LysR family regulator
VLNRRADLVEGPFDVAIWARERLDSEAGLIVRKLGVSRRILVVAPDYLKLRPPIGDPADLQHEQLVTLAEDGAETEWIVMRQSSEQRVVELTPRFMLIDTLHAAERRVRFDQFEHRVTPLVDDD